MKWPGQVVLFHFPQTNLATGKLRPALLLKQLPGPYDDWLICMISSQLRQYQEGFDEIVREEDDDFKESGLKVTSVIRVGRLAVVEGNMLVGSIGEIRRRRMIEIRMRLADWITGEEPIGRWFSEHTGAP